MPLRIEMLETPRRVGPISLEYPKLPMTLADAHPEVRSGISAGFIY